MRKSVLRRWFRRAPALVVVAAAAAAVLALLVVESAAAQQRVVFRWGRSMQISSYELDLEERQLVLILPAGGTVTVPLSIVRHVLGAEEEVVLDLDLDAASPDPEEPEGTSPWMAAAGWSGSERWDEWENAPKWEFRWTDEDSASALVPPPPDDATQIELRLLSIAYAVRILGGVAEPETQVLSVALGETPLGMIELGDEGWETYRLPLPADRPVGPVLLRLQTGYRARPGKRILGVALDYVRYCRCEGTGAAHEVP